MLYAFHNWDLPVVACAVGAVYAVHAWRTPRPLADRAVVAAVLLGLGFAFKLYPGAFVLPLALLVLTAPGRGAPLDWRGAARVPLAAAVTVVLVNLPFAVAGYEGWRASFTFQELRKVDITTNSIWYWGFRPYSEHDEHGVPGGRGPALARRSCSLSFVAACAVGWWRWRREGGFPWIGVSAAMLCGFLLLHKVHSPQYTLWLLPFFVLLRVRWGWIAAYLVADLAMYVGIFRLFYLLNAGADAGIFAGFTAQAVAIGRVGPGGAARGAVRGVPAASPRRWSSTGSSPTGRARPAGRLTRAGRPSARRRQGSVRSAACSPAPRRTGQSGSSRPPPTARTGSVSGRSTVRTTTAISATTSASRATAVPRNQSGGSPRAEGPR